MKNAVTIINVLFVSIFILLVSSCKNKEAEPIQSSSEFDELGQINLVVTGNQDAQEQFKIGLLLLHSFEYEDAREAFLEAQKADSTMVMAYWGEAMTFNHSLWQRQEKEKAVLALNKLSNDPDVRIEMAKTELEKDLMKAVSILYADGTKYERDVFM